MKVIAEGNKMDIDDNDDMGTMITSKTAEHSP